MSGHDIIDSRENARVLMLSQRNVRTNLLFRCGLYEFEDIIRKIDAVDMLAPKPNSFYRYGYRISNRLSQDTKIILNPGVSKYKVKKDYEIFFVPCMLPFDLLHIESVEGWKERCKTSICLLSEIYLKDLLKLKGCINILSKFDYVMLHNSHTVKAMNQEIGSKCIYMPPGIDTVLFCPYPDKYERVIDVYSIGRKARLTHEILMQIAKEKRLFYLYDMLDGGVSVTTNAVQHRRMIAETAKRSKYFIVNPGKIDLPEETNNQSEIGFRYFEGAASGTVMIGERPNTDEYDKYFFWKDAVVHLPYNSVEIGELISELSMDVKRQENIRINNVTYSLKLHDWAYRWEDILKVSNAKPTKELIERKYKLNILADSIIKH